MKHKDVTVNNAHSIHQWEYATSSERLSATGFSRLDIGKLALQLDNYTLWRLVDTSPTWSRLGNSDITINTVSSTDTLVISNGSITENSGNEVELTFGSTDYWYDLENKLEFTSTPDDMFYGSTLDSKWTVTAGSSGTASLFTSSGGIYDLTSRLYGILAIPIANYPVRFRQEYTLPSGYSVIACISPNLNMSGQGGISDSEVDIGITLTISDSYSELTDYVTTHFDSEVEGWRIYGGNMVSSTFTGYSMPQNKPVPPICRKIYLLIRRDGTTYSTGWSVDGITWVMYPGVTHPVEHDYLWLFAQVTDSTGNPQPIQCFNWVKVVPNFNTIGG